MRRTWISLFAILSLLAVGCSTQGPHSTPKQDQPPEATADLPKSPTGKDSRPVLVTAEYNNQARQEEMPGNGTVYVVRTMAHIQATVEHSEHVEWRLYPISPGPDGTNKPLSVLLPHLTDGKWILDWNDPPATPVRMTLYAQVGADVPDDPSLRRENGKRWVILTSVLLKGIDLGPGDGTGVISTPPTNTEALNAVVSQFYTLLAKGDYESAMKFLHPTSFAPYPERKRQVFASLQGQAVPGLAEIVGAQMWASWKFPWCMCRVPEVTEVVVKLTDGTRTSVWAKQDENNEWRLLWNPR